MNRYRTGRHWGVTIVREGEHPGGGDCFETCNGHRPGDQLVAVVVNGDHALAERICELLNAGETGGPRSVLGDQIVMHGPYVAGQRMTPLLAGMVDLTEINALRDELVALRAIATGGSA